MSLSSPKGNDAALKRAMAEARACALCAAHLPLGPRPVFRLSTAARLLIVGQAPGTKVHETGIPWNDRSGDRLRQWMGIERAAFYDEARVAIMPMGFCYPGALAGGGDAPPRPECAPRWHPRLLALLPRIELTLLVGGYAIAGFIDANKRAQTMTETVWRFADFLPRFLPLPHPSWRTTAWERNNRWFADRVLPELRERVRALTA
ncbi:MAG: uracil-DNA glycosylase family protein [Rhodospirillales bacterium]